MAVIVVFEARVSSLFWLGLGSLFSGPVGIAGYALVLLGLAWVIFSTRELRSK
jgi:hypothetical protein